MEVCVQYGDHLTVRPDSINPYWPMDVHLYDSQNYGYPLNYEYQLNCAIVNLIGQKILGICF